jgi:hypothetical protein
MKRGQVPALLVTAGCTDVSGGVVAKGVEVVEVYEVDGVIP